MATSRDTHSVAASFEPGSRARLATSANRTRSTSVVNRRGPSSVRNAVSMPSWCHNPSSNHTPPRDRDEVTRSRSTSTRPVPGVRVGVAQVAGDRGHQPAQPVGVQGVLPAQVDQHPGPGLPVDPLVVRQRHVAHDRPVGVLAAGHPEEHVHQSIREPRTPWAGHDQLVCPHIPAPPGPNQAQLSTKPALTDHPTVHQLRNSGDPPWPLLYPTPLHQSPSPPAPRR